MDDGSYAAYRTPVGCMSAESQQEPPFRNDRLPRESMGLSFWIFGSWVANTKERASERCKATSKGLLQYLPCGVRRSSV